MGSHLFKFILSVAPVKWYSVLHLQLHQMNWAFIFRLETSTRLLIIYCLYSFPFLKTIVRATCSYTHTLYYHGNCLYPSSFMLTGRSMSWFGDNRWQSTVNVSIGLLVHIRFVSFVYLWCLVLLFWHELKFNITSSVCLCFVCGLFEDDTKLTKRDTGLCV